MTKHNITKAIGSDGKILTEFTLGTPDRSAPGTALPTRRLGPQRLTAAALDESVCANGGCTRQRYRSTTFCFRCWAGVKWTSINLRVRNVNGRCKSYVGLPVGFTRAEFLAWVFATPPPDWMARPSIDRIVPALGYVPGNIRWLEMRQNARGPRREDSIVVIHCPKCGRECFDRCYICKAKGA